MAQLQTYQSIYELKARGRSRQEPVHYICNALILNAMLYRSECNDLMNAHFRFYFISADVFTIFFSKRWTMPLNLTNLQLTPTTLLTYLRLKHCISKQANSLYAIPSLVWYFLTNTNSSQKGISLIYSTFISKKTFVKSKPFLLCKTDMKATFIGRQHIYKSTSCSALWEQTKKISLR